MLRTAPHPSAAHRAFALSAEAGDEAMRLARHVAEAGPRAASRAIGAWIDRAPGVSHDRKTPLDPRIEALVVRLRALPLGEEMDERRHAALAGWSAAPRAVWGTPETSLAYGVVRTLQLAELSVPELVLEAELDAIERSVAALDGPPPRMWSGPEDDPGPFVELPHAIARYAASDLSLGASTAVLAVLGHASSSLAPGAPLLPAEVSRFEDPAENLVLERLGAWRRDSGAALAGVAARLAETSASPRADANERLDREVPEPLRGDDHVGAAAARLEEIASDARAAHAAGLVVFSTVG